MTILRRLASAFWVRAIVTIAILAYLAADIDMVAAARAILGVDRGLLAAVLVLVACDRAVMILRWTLLLGAAGVAIDLRTAARIYLVSSFVGSFLPAGIGGDAARAYGLSRATTSGSEALASVAVDRLLGIVALLLMGGIGLIAWTGREADARLIVAVALVTAAVLAVFWTDWLLRRLVPTRWHHHHVGRRLLKLGDALSRYRGRGGALAHVFAWSVAVQLLRIVQASLLGLGLGLAVPFTYYLLFMPLGLLMLLLPVSISGFGVPQGVIVWLLRPMGVPDERAFALSTLIILTGLAGNLPGMLLWLRRRH